MEKIAAIVVTYNRLELLKQCIEGVRSQTRKLDQIIVVNNSSTDGTSEWLLKQPDLMVINVRNCGSAGGYYEGIKWAYEAKFDWFWLLDDDILPLPYALEIELKFSKISKCINSPKIDLRGNRMLWQGYIDEASGFIIQYKDEFQKNKDWIEVNYGCFEGMLISRDIVARIGFPKKEFFIMGDDIYYGYLASKFTNVIYIKDPCFVKMISATYDTIDRYTYLYFRNVVGYIYRKISRKKYLYINRLILHYMFHFVKFLGQLKLNKIYKMTKGIFDGLTENFNDNQYF